MTEEDLVLFFTPSLVATLLRAEQEKGTPLSEDEVLQIRDRSTCVAIPTTALQAAVEDRGYEDIDPHDCWNQWQAVRVDLTSEN